MNQSMWKKLKQIKLLLLDVDGILTDARITWVEGTGWTQSYSVRDGYGIQLLMRSGVEVGFISGGDMKSLHERVKKLNIQHFICGEENKLKAFEKLKLAFKDNEIAYMADELNDIPLLEKVGFSASVPEAVPEVKRIVHYITKNAGGYGAAREVIDMIRYAQDSKTWGEYRARLNK